MARVVAGTSGETTLKEGNEGSKVPAPRRLYCSVFGMSLSLARFSKETRS